MPMPALKFSSAFVILKEGSHVATIKIRERKSASLVHFALPSGALACKTISSPQGQGRASKTIAEAASNLMKSNHALSNDQINALMLAAYNPVNPVQALKNCEYTVVEV